MATASIVCLVENQIEIAPRTVDIVEQKVRDNHVVVTVPLREQFCKQGGGEGVRNTCAENVSVEGFAWEALRG